MQATARKALSKAVARRSLATQAAAATSTAEPALPTRAKTVIVGGGVIGSSVAYHLTKHPGWEDCIVLEQDQLTSGTTWHAAGLIGALRNTSNETALSLVGQQLYRELEEETGISPGYKGCGSLTLARTPERMLALKRTLTRCRAFGVEAEIISPEETVAKYRHDGVELMSGDDLLGALWLPRDGTGSPTDLTMSLISGAKKRGARVFEKCRVDNFCVADDLASGVSFGDGAHRKVVGVETSSGHQIEAENVILCGGQWSRQLGQKAGVNVPLHSAEHFYIITKPIDGVHMDMPLMRDPDVFVYMREWSGGLCVGGFEPDAKPIWTEGVPDDFSFGLLPDDWDQFGQIFEGAAERIPALQTAELRSMVNGPESFTTDNAYILGEAPELSNFFLACGFNSSGIASAGGAGRALAHWVVNGQPEKDLFALDVRRFGKFHGNLEFLRDRTVETLGLHYSMPWPRRELSTCREQRTSPLYDDLKAAGASFGQKFGWERANWFARDEEAGEGSMTFATTPTTEYSFGPPNWWNNVRAEHENTRERVSVFDLSSFTKHLVQGRSAEDALQWLCGKDMRVEPGKCVYTQMLNAKGGIETDVTVTRLSPDAFVVVSPTAQATRDRDWMRRSLAAHPSLDAASVTVSDVTAATSV